MKTILDFQKYKNKNQKISLVTCYDYSFAKILNASIKYSSPLVL